MGIRIKGWEDSSGKVHAWCTRCDGWHRHGSAGEKSPHCLASRETYEIVLCGSYPFEVEHGVARLSLGCRCVVCIMSWPKLRGRRPALQEGFTKDSVLYKAHKALAYGEDLNSAVRMSVRRVMECMADAAGVLHYFCPWCADWHIQGECTVPAARNLTLPDPLPGIWPDDLPCGEGRYVLGCSCNTCVEGRSRGMSARGERGRRPKPHDRERRAHVSFERVPRGANPFVIAARRHRIESLALEYLGVTQIHVMRGPETAWDRENQGWWYFCRLHGLWHLHGRGKFDCPTRTWDGERVVRHDGIVPDDLPHGVGKFSWFGQRCACPECEHAYVDNEERRTEALKYARREIKLSEGSIRFVPR